MNDQANIDYLAVNGIERNIVIEYPNSVRVGIKTNWYWGRVS